MSLVIELADRIKEKGQTSAGELPELLQRAEQLALDDAQDVLTRALAHRAAGNARQLLNQFRPALESYNTAAALLETLDEPVELGRTLHAKVGMLFSLGRFDELFECAVRARRLFEQCSDRKRLARLDVNLAHAYHRLGRPKEALEHSERALVILEEIADVEGLIAASINSAVTLTAMHEFERAGERYRSAMRLATERNMSSWVLLSRYNLAYLQYLGGDTATALNEIAALRNEYERTHDEWMTCQCWLDESEILLEIGDLQDSIAAARRARALGEKLGLNAEVAKSLLHEAAAGLRLGGGAHSAELLYEATRRFSAEGDQVSSAVSRLQTALFRAENGDAAGLLDAVAARFQLRNSGLPHRRALADIVIGRIQRQAGDLDCAIESFQGALALAEHSRSEWMQFHAAYELGLSLLQKKDPGSLELFKRADRMLDSLWDRLGSDELKMTFLTDREDVYTHLVRSTMSVSPDSAFDYSEKARSRVLRERLVPRGRSDSAADVRSHLSAEEVIVEYFISGDDLNIFMVRQDGLTCVERPGVIPHLRAEWEHFERHIESCSVKWERLPSVRHHLDATAQQHLHHFYKELIAPIAGELRKTIIITPHGFLHSIPMHALYDGAQHLADRFQFAYTPSASLYCAPAIEQDFGGPLFVAFSTSPESSSIVEVEEAASFVNSPIVLINPSIEELRGAFATPRISVHIAGHAGVDAVSGKLAWIETTDSRLTSRDLTDMQIRTRTLVITGCQTARRLIQPGDEWLGLMRSFYLSGASTIVSALWDIRDQAARLFAAHFYKTFDGNNASLAVHTAARAVRQWRSHPYFWAGFGAFVRKSTEERRV